MYTVYMIRQNVDQFLISSHASVCMLVYIFLSFHLYLSFPRRLYIPFTFDSTWWKCNFGCSPQDLFEILNYRQRLSTASQYALRLWWVKYYFLIRCNHLRLSVFRAHCTRYVSRVEMKKSKWRRVKRTRIVLSWPVLIFYVVFAVKMVIWKGF